MRVAISTEGENVAVHFGRCPEFTLADIENGKVIKKEIIENPGHQPGYIPQFLRQRGVECIISGGMGRRASSMFEELGIFTLTGVEGKIDDVLKRFVEGTLKGGESLCKPGSGKGYGSDKTECDHSH
jgi:predicted Fe-Mo cluster-binding NifX family protein